MRDECVIVAPLRSLNNTEIRTLRPGMIFVDPKEATSGPGVAKGSEWGFPSSSKRPLWPVLRTFARCDSNSFFTDTQARLSQPVDSYAH
jgi:hypothetical protein